MFFFNDTATSEIYTLSLHDALPIFVVQHLGDRRGQRRLAVVDVTDGADVDVRLSPLELRLRHGGPPVGLWMLPGAGRCAPGPSRAGSGSSRARVLPVLLACGGADLPERSLAADL